MRIAVSGGRNYSDWQSLKHALNNVVRVAYEKYGTQESIVLIHGGATGADALSHKWAIWRVRTYGETIEVVIVEADWKKYGKAAGPIRNGIMSDGIPGYGKPDLWVIFPGGRGTADAYRKAMAAGIPTLCINPHDPNSPYIDPLTGKHALPIA